MLRGLIGLCGDRSQGSLAKLDNDSADTDTQLSKLDVVLTFQLEVSGWCHFIYVHLIHAFFHKEIK